VLKGNSELANRVIGAAIDVHKALGPGLLESAYQRCLAHEFSLRRLGFQAEIPLPIEYNGIRLDCGYRIDFIEDDILLELKSVDALSGIHEAQLLTYMKLAHKQHGFLINFNVKLLKQGIKRFVLYILTMKGMKIMKAIRTATNQILHVLHGKKKLYPR
jgi:GxxExxY protein